MLNPVTPVPPNSPTTRPPTRAPAIPIRMVTMNPPVVSRQNQFTQSPGYEPDYDPRNDTHLLDAPFVWCSLRAVYDLPPPIRDTYPARTSGNQSSPPSARKIVRLAAWAQLSVSLAVALATFALVYGLYWLALGAYSLSRKG